jgi:hypothetical protein
MMECTYSCRIYDFVKHLITIQIGDDHFADLRAHPLEVGEHGFAACHHFGAGMAEPGPEDADVQTGEIGVVPSGQHQHDVERSASSPENHATVAARTLPPQL